MIALTRCYGFPAAHVLRHPSFSQSKNEEVYGKCANPNGHGHNYGLHVTVSGRLDQDGRIVDPAQLDAIVEAQVVGRFSHRMLNDDILFADAVPTAENIARVAYDELAEPIRARTGARLVRVRVIETPKNFFDYGEPE